MAVTLEVRAASDMDAARTDVTSLGDAYRQLGSDIDSASASTDSGVSGFERMGESTDNLASKAGQATGGLGALAGGLEAVGATGAADALNATAVATDAMSGAGDLLNLVVETQAGQWLLNVAAQGASRVASIAGTAATVAMTGAQAALNAVMSLNPVALVVISVLALVAGVILAYKHSETFREIVQKVFDAASGYVGLYVDAIGKVIDIIQSVAGVAKDVWDKVSGAVKDATGDAVKFITDLYEDIKSGAEGIVSAVSGAFSSAFAPIQTAIGWVQDLIDKIANIDFPDFPDLNPFRTSAGGISKEDFLDPFNPNGINAGNILAVPITVKAEEQDKDKAMRTLIEGLRDYFARQGMTLSLTEEP